MKTFSTAHKELMEKLAAERQALQVKTINESLEKWEKTEREKVGGSGVHLIEAVTALRDLALTSVQSSVSARLVSVQTAKSSMQAAQNEKDTFRFLQMYSQAHQDVEKAKAVDLRQGMEPGSVRDTLLQEIRRNGEKMTAQAGRFLESLLALVDPKTNQELVFVGSDLIFDPQTLGDNISLSKDKRKVFYSGWPGQYSVTLLISSSQSLPNLRRWIVSLSQDSDWTIGLCDKTSARNLKDGPVYGLCCKGKQLSSLTTESDESSDAPVNPQIFGATKSVTSKMKQQHTALIKPQGTSEDQTRPEVVEVFWNFTASSLSFYRRTGQYQREEIITIKMSLNNWDFVPFVQITKESGQNASQQTQKSSYGQSTFSFQPTCSFGETNVYAVCATEMICELK